MSYSELEKITQKNNLLHQSQNAAAVSTIARLHKLPVVIPAGEKPKVVIGKALISLRKGTATERMDSARKLGDISASLGIKMPEAVVPLIATLAMDHDPSVRQEAAWSLWKIGDERAHKPLIRAMLHDESHAVSEKAARVLGLLDVRDSIEMMTGFLRVDRHVHAKLRAGIICAFGYFAEEKLFSYITKAAGDAEPIVRYEVVRSLGRFIVNFSSDISRCAEKILIRSLRLSFEPCVSIREAAIMSLRFSKSEQTNLAVAESLRKDPDSSVREAAAESLIIWNSPYSERALIEALSDEFWHVRKAAARTLSRFIARHGVYDSTSACEALRRMARMFPSHSLEWRLASAALSSL